MRKERITYCGIVFTRYPDSPRRQHRVYYWPSKTRRDRSGVKALHVEVYKAEVGPIPDGWHVHHKNENPLDNDPGNLEALPPAEHTAHHAIPNDGYGRWNPGVLEGMRELAKAWHSSPEGVAWHSEHGRQTWVDREKVPAGNCFGCGAEIESYRPPKGNGHRWCSRLCFQKWADRNRLYHHEKTCEECGGTFLGRIKAKYCSRTCATRVRNRNRGRVEPVSSGAA